MHTRSLKIIFLFFISAIHASPSWAELGGAVTQHSTQAEEQIPLVATVQTLNVYQAKNPSGTQIKEYANADGVVVAVSWQGPTLPNLKQLLGNYFDAFSHRSTTNTTGHRSAEMRTDDLVVQSHGQMRSFSGRAYLPKLLPADFNVDQIN